MHVPSKNWDKVTVDLFVGHLPSPCHVVVLQDLASYYPAAKLVTSTEATSVLPGFAEIYDNYGNPETHIIPPPPPPSVPNRSRNSLNREILH